MVFISNATNQFTTLSKEQRERIRSDSEAENKKHQNSTERLMRLEVTSPTPSLSGGLFPTFCIFALGKHLNTIKTARANISRN